MRKIWRKPKPVQEKRFRANDHIRVPEIFLINEEGEKIGIMPTRKAREMADEAGLDLVEVNPRENPPICKIMDYGQFKYELDKKSQKQKLKQKKIETKGIRLSVRIDEHDFQVRYEQAVKFLNKGNKLKLELQLKGRERQHPQKAYDVVNRFVDMLESNSELNLMREQDLTKQGYKYIILLANKAK